MFGKCSDKVACCKTNICSLWALCVAALVIPTILIFQRMPHISWKDFKAFSNQNTNYQNYIGTRAKVGTIWPRPQHVATKSKTFILLPNQFRILYKPGSFRCPEVDLAVQRYMRIIFGHSPSIITPSVNATQLEVLQISIFQPCETYPSIKSSERYILIVEDEASYLVSSTQWGILRGLETFSQLVHRSKRGEFVIRETEIEDFPRFPYRGLMVDTARHFLPVQTLLKNLEIMSYNKMNVLHWHLTDHQSFPIEFEAMPELARKGAFDNETMIYKEEDVRRVVEFARMRGIRVIPEIDFPGHSNALAKSMPHLFVQCNDKKTGKPLENERSLNPVQPAVYEFAGKIYAELQKLFPDKNIHLGGDEVPHKCWFENPAFREYARKADLKDRHIHQRMQEGFLQEARKLNLKPIVWDDAFNNGFSKTPATVQAWFPSTVRQRVAGMTAGGVDIIVSYPFYLDNEVHKSWEKMYRESVTGIVPRADQKNILGGEACMWGEHIDETNIILEVWPSASAIAENLWSEEYAFKGDATKRLRNLQCVMETRGGIKTTPVGPGHCNRITV